MRMLICFSEIRFAVTVRLLRIVGAYDFVGFGRDEYTQMGENFQGFSPDRLDCLYLVWVWSIGGV